MNITFSATDKLKALAIVAAFETGSAFGKFSTVAVLNDGAGISYGFCQFTHRSGALAEVLERYRALGGTVGIVVIACRIQLVRLQTRKAVDRLSRDEQFRKALRAAGITDEMKQAQVDVALERFLKPAELECSRLKFTSPLALAVIHDSIVHGSWERIRDRLLKSSPPYEGGVAAASGDGVVLTNEQKFITSYVEARDKWLGSIPRLASTRYRTRFFLNQIKLQNWKLDLPLRPNGVTITADAINKFQQFAGDRVSCQQVSAVGPSFTIEPQIPSLNSSDSSNAPPTMVQPPMPEPRPIATGPTGILDDVETHVNDAAARYDQVERIATTVTTRNDAAKSLWTTVIGSVTQTLWAVFGLIAGVPREVWLVVALVAAALMVMYLYRQIALGKIRERVSGSKFHVSS